MKKTLANNYFYRYQDVQATAVTKISKNPKTEYIKKSFVSDKYHFVDTWDLTTGLRQSRS